MKKITTLAIVMVAALALAMPAWSMPATLDHAIDNTMKSDIGPVADSGRILDMTNRGVTTGYNMVTEPMAPVLDPVRKVRDVTIDGSKKVINTVWDMVTFKHFRK